MYEAKHCYYLPTLYNIYKRDPSKCEKHVGVDMYFFVIKCSI